MVRDSNEGRTEKHERSPWLRPAMLGSMKARPRAASADVTLASSSIHGAEYVQQANVRGLHNHETRERLDHVFDRNPKRDWSTRIRLM